MKKFKKILPIILVSLMLFGFTIVDYDEYREPSWVWRDCVGGKVPGAATIKGKTHQALKNIESKGLTLKPFTIHISPYEYEWGHVRGLASRRHNAIVLADNNIETIYHEIGHIYEYQNKGLLEKYAKDMKKYYPDIEIEAPEFEPWKKKISEDFAEEFRLIFTGGEKRTLYPPFPNFYEWLLKNTQPEIVKREEVFEKLGDTQDMINKGIIKGYGNGYYGFERPITRAELSALLVRIDDLKETEKAPFKDIKGKWYQSYVDKIYKKGLVEGYPDNTFKGDKNISRYELHMILNRR